MAKRYPNMYSVCVPSCMITSVFLLFTYYFKCQVIRKKSFKFSHGRKRFCFCCDANLFYVALNYFCFFFVFSPLVPTTDTRGLSFDMKLKPTWSPLHDLCGNVALSSVPCLSSFARTAPGTSSTPATPSSSGKVKSRSRSKSPFRSFRWKTAKKLLAGTHHSDDEGIRGRAR